MGAELPRSPLRLGTGGPLRARYLPFVVLPIAGGAGLVVHILAGLSLRIAFVTLVAVGAAGWVVVLRRLDGVDRADLLRRTAVGALAGAIATLAYDGARLALVTVGGMSLNPFHAWRLFGRALAGPDSPAGTVLAVGTLYHAVNGIGFGIVFLLVVSRPRLWLGISWGLGLEAAMAVLYPTWMVITQLREFLTVSVLGHLVYGATLAVVAGAALGRTARDPEAVR